MPNGNIDLVNTSGKEMKRKCRKKRERERVAAVFVVAVMTMIAHWYPHWYRQKRLKY